MTIGKVERFKATEFYPNGKKLKCIDCLYGHRYNCPSGITRLCGKYLGWLPKWKYEITKGVRGFKKHYDMILFFEIIDNKDYYAADKNENGDDARWYIYCEECGYIPWSRKAFDECINKGHFVQCENVFSEVEIYQMKEDKKYSDLMSYDYDD